MVATSKNNRKKEKIKILLRRRPKRKVESLGSMRRMLELYF